MKKYVLIIPILLLVLSVVYLATTPLNLDVDLKGGTLISIETKNTVSSSNIENLLSDYGASVRVARGLDNYVVLVEFDAQYDSVEVMGKLSEYNFTDYSIQTVSPSLGSTFFKQATIALVVAFIFMAIVVFILFKKLLPSFYVVVAAGADIIETLVVSQLLGIDLSLAIFAALLLMIGYSVDSDILLTTRILKREGEISEKMKNARITGFTMSATTLAAMCGLYLISTSAVITQIASVLIIGILLDLINTWLFNAPLIEWYAGRNK